MRALVTGGAGYLGSHLVVDLLRAGHDVVVLDDFSSGHPAALARAELLGRPEASVLDRVDARTPGGSPTRRHRPLKVVRGDVADLTTVHRALEGVDLVFHLAASKQVGESMERPERYFRNNVGGMATLLEGMVHAGVRRIVYSSSAAVYGAQAVVPIPEGAPLSPESPYGLSKAHGEQMLGWMADRRGWSAVSLRYFNPVGAHSTGWIGEPMRNAQSLVPRALMAVAGRAPPLHIFGDDYPTEDGTCQRDFVHVSDLTRAHLSVLDLLDRPGHHTFNVGTGRPYSVLEVLAACGRVVGRPVPAVRASRRPGDPAVSTADPNWIRDVLGFQATLGIDDMVASAWRWFMSNPDGYPDDAVEARAGVGAA